jgi:hypothetical protein
MEGQFQLASGRAIIQRVVVTELAATDGQTVIVVLCNGRKHVRVPHEVDLEGGDERELVLRKDLEELVIVLNGLLEKAIVLIDRTGDLPKEAGLGRSRCQDVVAVEQYVKIVRRGNIVQSRVVIMLETMPSKHGLMGKNTGPSECGWHIWLAVGLKDKRWRRLKNNAKTTLAKGFVSKWRQAVAVP